MAHLIANKPGFNTEILRGQHREDGAGVRHPGVHLPACQRDAPPPAPRSQGQQLVSSPGQSKHRPGPRRRDRALLPRRCRARNHNHSHNAWPQVSFFLDPAHLDGLTGARTLAELVMHLFDVTVEDVTARPVTPEEAQAALTATLPPPLLPGNYESVADRCLMGPVFKSAVRQANGFEWVNESKGARARWGMVATTVRPLVGGGTCSRVEPQGQATALGSHHGTRLRR